MTSKNKTYVKKQIQKERNKTTQDAAARQLTVEEQLELFATLIADHLLITGNEQDNQEDNY